jgi:hypothetical protein
VFFLSHLTAVDDQLLSTPTSIFSSSRAASLPQFWMTEFHAKRSEDFQGKKFSDAIFFLSTILDL